MSSLLDKRRIRCHFLVQDLPLHRKVLINTRSSENVQNQPIVFWGVLEILQTHSI
jgi:hypothetical protein